ncbi:hypothetical protein OROGR_032923 [Orobanche gracilis]
MVTNRDLADTYQPPFRKCIKEGRASGIMCAYNRVNGVPNCADYNLLTKTARKEWDFNGYITSDCDAVSIIHDNYKYARLPEDAVADVLKAGMDVNCGWYLKNYTKSAIEQKKLAEIQVDRALHNLFAVRMRLGLFNGNPKQLVFDNIGPDQASSSLAVVGPNARNAYALVGNYEGPPCKSLEIDRALQGYVKNILYHEGCNAVNCTSAAIGDAVETAKQADHVVLVMGLDQSEEREDHDRVDLTLPGQQESLIKAVAAASKKPVVLVLVCGGPVDVSFAKDDPKIGSILWAGYPGEAGGIALAEVIFGVHNPGGKLPVTWYPKDFTSVPMTDMRMRPEPSLGYPGRTYRFYTGKKVFEFGYGLSYSTYSYEFISSTPNTTHLNQLVPRFGDGSSSSTGYLSVAEIGEDACETLKFSTHVGVENTGDMAGKHPVLLFVRHATPRNGGFVKQLVGFETVSLNAGERTEVEFVLNPCEHLSTANEDGVMVIEKGYIHLMVEDKEYTINIVL